MFAHVAIAGLLLFALSTAPAQSDDESKGYWKYHVPALNKPFGNDDVVALAQGRHVKTDCSVPWIGGDGNTYCFQNVASREAFLHAPMDYYRQAERVLQRERGTSPQSSRTIFNGAKSDRLFAIETQEKSRC